MTSDRHVHIVDDDEAVRRSLSFLLTTAGYTVDLWGSGLAFLAAAPRVMPGCVLLDIRMPGANGFAVQRGLADADLFWPVVVITGHGDIATAIKAMKAGALDFIEKPMAREVLLSAVEMALSTLHDNRLWIASADAAQIAIGRLTPREETTLAGLARGLSNRRIAGALGISVRTVEVHRANAMAKLGAGSLSQALHVAFAAGVDRDDRPEYASSEAAENEPIRASGDRQRADRRRTT